METRHVHYFRFDTYANPNVFEKWLNKLPGRLLVLAPWPKDANLMYAVTVEEST